MNRPISSTSMQTDIDKKDNQTAGNKLPWHPPKHKSIRQGQVAAGILSITSETNPATQTAAAYDVS